MATNKLLRSFKRLPDFTGEASALHAILDKLPQCLSKRCGELRDLLYEGEADGVLPWDEERLVKKIAVHLGKGQTEVNYGERPLGKGNGKCTNCGSTSHTWRECTKTCGKCGLGMCPGARGDCRC